MIQSTRIEFFYSSMTDPIALAVAFPGNLETKFLKYLGSILDIIFSKYHILSNEDFSTTDLRDEQ